MKRGAFVLAGALVWLSIAVTAALWLLPARWLMAWVPAVAPVRVVAAEGSMWQATAWLAIGAPGLQRRLPQPAHWTLGWQAGPRLQLTHPWLQGPLVLRLDWRGLNVSAQHLRLPATALTTLHSVFNTLDPGGTLALSWPAQHLSWRGQRAHSAQPVLALVWHEASSGLSRVQPLGRYRLSVGAPADPAQPAYPLQLATETGALRLQGEGTLGPAHALQFEAWAWADAQAPASQQAGLVPLLQTLGPAADAQDRRHLRWPP